MLNDANERERISRTGVPWISYGTGVEKFFVFKQNDLFSQISNVIFQGDFEEKTVRSMWGFRRLFAYFHSVETNN